MRRFAFLHKKCYPSGAMKNPRYAPERPFPPYVFTPGGPHPHPEKPGGYLHGKSKDTVTSASLAAHPHYLYALDLFNHHYPWEGHVWLEALWHQVGRKGQMADFFKALIKLCAANVKEAMNAPKPAAGHRSRALELLQESPPVCLGLDTVALKSLLERGQSPSRLLLQEESISLGAGCFWGVEHALALLPGVLQTTCGYMGGEGENPSYEQVCRGNTGHAEVVQVRFVPSIIPLEQLLAAFWLIHDPTEKNRQGPDVGSQYRSAIFCQNQQQLERSQESLKQESSRHQRPVVTEISVETRFYPAEEYHQQYLANTPGGYCHISPELFDRIRKGLF